MKRGLSLLIGLSLMLASYGCIVEHQDGEYQRHHEGYREHQEHRNGGFDRDHDDNRGRDEHRDDEERH